MQVFRKYGEIHESEYDWSRSENFCSMMNEFEIYPKMKFMKVTKRVEKLFEAKESTEELDISEFITMLSES